MSRNWLLVGASLGMVLAATTTSCDKPPTAPTAPTPPPNGPAGPVVVSLEIAGPASIAPGQSAQYSLLQRWSDNSTRPVGAAQWSSSNRTLLQVTESGLATTAPLYGETTLQAQVGDAAAPGPRQATREILVQPDGTFRLVGAILEADTGLRVPGARLEARVDANLSAPIVTFATTGTDGAYRLYGVPPDPFMHVRKPGYRSTTVPIQLAAHATRVFDLELDGQRLALAGAYTMTVEAEGSSFYCGSSGSLRDDLKRRTYGADITQDGPRLTITLSGAFAATGSGNRFSGVASVSGADVELLDRGDYWSPEPYNYPDVVEVLGDGTVLVTHGRATLVQTPTGLSGNLAGSMRQYSGPTLDRFLAACRTATLTLTRR